MSKHNLFKNNSSFTILRQRSAFTIVELLVVIVIIGILAAISMVSYSGISGRAIVAGIKSDLNSNSKLLEMYKVEHDSYPTALDPSNCPSAPEADAKYCLKTSPDNTLEYTGTDSTYDLTITHDPSDTAYETTEAGVITDVTGGGSGGGSVASSFVGIWSSADDEDDSGRSIVQTSDGGFAVAGNTLGLGAGSQDMLIAKYSSDGTLAWNKTWGGTGPENCYSIIQTADGGFAVTGRTYSFGGNPNMFIVKYTSDGTLSWDKTWGSPDYYDAGYSIIQTADGGFVVTGDTNGFGNGSDMFIVKYTSDGTLSWDKTWGDVGDEYGNSITQTADGGFAVTGETDGFGVIGSDMFIVKYTSDGTLSWNKTWGSPDYDGGYSIIQTIDGGFAITGETDGFGVIAGDMFIVKYTSDGTLSWNKTWGSSDVDYGASISQSIDGGFVITGKTDGFGAGDSDMSIVKYTSSGILSWNKTWGSSNWDSGR